MTEKFALKITSAVAIDGEIKKANSVVHVGEFLAKDLLNRGKAVVATAEDVTAAERPVRGEEPDDGEGGGAEPEAGASAGAATEENADPVPQAKQAKPPGKKK